MDKTIQKPPFHYETLGVLKSLCRNLGFYEGFLIADYQDIQYLTAAKMEVGGGSTCVERNQHQVRHGLGC